MDQKEKWDAIRAEIIRRRAAGESFQAISKLMGARKGGTLAYKIHTGVTSGERINEDKTCRYMKALGLGVEIEEATKVGEEDFQLVPRVKARLGAGSSLITDDTPDGFYAFRRDWLRSLGINAKPVMMHVSGDSMLPTLTNDDMVMIDQADRQIKSGQLYAVGIGEELLIKRVIVSPAKTIILKSDNPDYPTWEVPACDDLRIIGRAKWLGRAL